MFTKLKKQRRDLTKAKPGERFQNRYYRRRNTRSTGLLKLLYLVVGSALLVLGVVLLPAPGPGFLVIFIGAAMIAEESLAAAKGLDHAEVALRALLSRATRAWRRASAALKTLVVAFGTLLAAAAGWAAYTVLFH